MSEINDIDRAFLLLVLITSLGVCFVWAFWELEQARNRWRRRREAARKFKSIRWMERR